MEVHFTPEQQAKLYHLAAQQGRDPDRLLQDFLDRYLEDETASSKALSGASRPPSGAS